jgi:hypothetical protein
MKRNTLLGELSAELLGTFTLIIFGVGVVAQTVLTPFTAGAQSIHWAWGLGVVMGVYVAGGISGAHINPAVTLAMAVRRGFPWGKVLPYWVAQTVGAFMAASTPPRGRRASSSSRPCRATACCRSASSARCATRSSARPCFGGVLGAYVYDAFISRFLPVAEPEVGRVPEAPEAARADT